MKNDSETTNKTMSDHNRHLTLKLEQLQEMTQKEVGRLQVELQQTSSDLERSREQQSVRSQELLQLQQELFVEQTRMSDARTQLMHAQNSLALEVGTREKLDQRYGSMTSSVG